MKKGIIALMVFMLLFCLAACGNDTPTASQEQNTKPTQGAIQTPTDRETNPTEPTQPQHTHDFETVMTEAGCESKGYTTYTCACGETYQGDWIDAMGHNFVDGVCSVCNEYDPAVATEPTEGMRPDFVAAMDAYVAFFEEYCDFMRAYLDNPSDPALLEEYIDFVQQYADTMEKLYAWETTDLNAEELKYYMDVVGRISQMVVDFVPQTNPDAPEEMRPEFKDAMDSYEAFCVEYCALLKQYYANPTDYTLLIQYSSMMTEYMEMTEKIQEWDNGELNTEEMKYYIEVTTRVSQMIVDAMP